MFEARLVQGSILKKIIEAMKDLVNEANLECSEEGLKLQAMDSSHVSLISLNLGKDMFEEYRCDRNLFLGLNLANLSKILKCAGNDDVITLSAQDEGDSVTLQFENKEDKSSASFEVKLMDIDGEHLAIPETEYKATATLPSSEFQRICRDMATIGDTCTISILKDGVKFSVKGDLGSGSIERKKKEASTKDKTDAVEVEMEEPVELTFALRYLNFFTKAGPLSPYVVLHMNQGTPLLVEYKIEEGAGGIKYFLAPKIDDEAA